MTIESKLNHIRTMKSQFKSTYFDVGSTNTIINCWSCNECSAAPSSWGGSISSVSSCMLPHQHGGSCTVFVPNQWMQSAANCCQSLTVVSSVQLTARTDHQWMHRLTVHCLPQRNPNHPFLDFFEDDDDDDDDELDFFSSS